MEFTSYTSTTKTYTDVPEQPVAPEETVQPSNRESELQDDLLRLQAEYVNYRKRVERDRDVARDSAVQSTLTALLPVLDGIYEARKHGDLEDGPFASIANKLDTIIAQLGMDRIDATGVLFDPTVHEAVIRQAHAEIPAEHVSQVFREGYKVGERTIRAAQVMVSAGE